MLRKLFCWEMLVLYFLIIYPFLPYFETTETKPAAAATTKSAPTKAASGKETAGKEAASNSSPAEEKPAPSESWTQQIVQAIYKPWFATGLTNIFIFAILALALNVVVGYTGLLHLGIAAFFGIGAYVTGILTYPGYPFQIGFWWSALVATLFTGLCGMLLGLPTLRLRGDYLALVTLGFGEVVKYSLRNLEQITNGTRGINPIPPPWEGDTTPSFIAKAAKNWDVSFDWNANYRLYYFLTLGILVIVLLLLRNLERSRLGRAWMAIREDELAATCMGINANKVKLSAFATAAALAGLAGCLYATKLGSTAQPDAFDFNRSMLMLCCIILGGLGSRGGTLLGVFLIIGFDSMLTPIVDEAMQKSEWIVSMKAKGPTMMRLFTFSSWRLLVFGLALILMMRFRPEGVLPSRRIKRELHHEMDQTATGATNAAS